MSEDPYEMPISESAYLIRQAMLHFDTLTQEQHIDLAVQASVLTREQGERAKKRWAEIQAEHRTEASEPGCDARLAAGTSVGAEGLLEEPAADVKADDGGPDGEGD